MHVLSPTHGNLLIRARMGANNAVHRMKLPQWLATYPPLLVVAEDNGLYLATASRMAVLARQSDRSDKSGMVASSHSLAAINPLPLTELVNMCFPAACFMHVCLRHTICSRTRWPLR